MNWLNSIFISLLTGALGILCGGLIMSLCVGWYRISSFEGKSGYAIIAVALLGGIAGFAVGLITSRFLFGGTDPGFLKVLGCASGAVGVIALVALGLCRLNADLAPEIDGQSLELAIEVRCPQGFTLPTKLDEYGATAEVYLPRGRRLPTGPLRLAEATQHEGHWVVPATVPLTTSSSNKHLSVRFNADASLIFNLPLRSNPQRSDLEWSKWVESGWDAGKPEPAKEAKFNARYRVQLFQPPEPGSDPAALAAAEAEKRFATLDPGEPLPNWLEFFGSDSSPERNNAIAEVFAGRQDELATLIRSPDAAMREKALLAAEYLPNPTKEIGEAVLAEGRALADAIKASNTLSADDPTLAPTLRNLSSRFSIWRQTWWVVHQRLGLDGRPIYREIRELASVRPHGTAIDEIEVNAGVVLDQLEK